VQWIFYTGSIHLLVYYISFQCKNTCRHQYFKPFSKMISFLNYCASSLGRWNTSMISRPLTLCCPFLLRVSFCFDLNHVQIGMNLLLLLERGRKGVLENVTCRGFNNLYVGGQSCKVGGSLKFNFCCDLFKKLDCNFRWICWIWWRILALNWSYWNLSTWSIMGNKDMKLNRSIKVNSCMSFNAENWDGKLSFGRCQSSLPLLLYCVKSQEYLNFAFKVCGLCPLELKLKFWSQHYCLNVLHQFGVFGIVKRKKLGPSTQSSATKCVLVAQSLMWFRLS